MNKLIIAITTFFLAGCQATLPETQNNEKDISATSSAISKDVIIKPVNQIETSKLKSGEYPIQYRYIISNYSKSPNTILFKPVEYETSTKEKAWATCAKINNKSQLFIIKNNNVIENISSKDIYQKCEKLKIEQDTKENAYYLLNMEKYVDNFKSIVDDTEKSYLFGDTPSNPEQLILSQLSYFTPNFDNAKLEDISVRKTFFLINDQPIYSYLIFANLVTPQNIKKSIFYYKDGVLLNHKVFHDENTSTKGEILKNIFEEETEEASLNNHNNNTSSSIKNKTTNKPIAKKPTPNKATSAKEQKTKPNNSKNNSKQKSNINKKTESKKRKS